MIDYLASARQAMIENFQISLRAVRSLMGYSVAELAEFMGVTRQTVNNLETGKAKMSSTQFISLAAIVDNYLSNNGEMANAIETIINENGKKRNINYDTSLSYHSLLKRWFACFNDPIDCNKIAFTHGTQGEYAELLKKLATSYKIFVDSDTLLEPSFEIFSKFFSEYLLDDNAKFIIPLRAIEQIQENILDVDISDKATKTLKQITSLQRKDLIQIRGEDSDSDIHDTIMSVFIKFRSSYRLCLITQNKSFANEIKYFNEHPDRPGFNILIGYIDEKGMFKLYRQELSVSKDATEIEPKLTSWEQL